MISRGCAFLGQLADARRWRAFLRLSLAVLAALLTVAVSVLGAAPASAVAPPSTYDTAVYAYDASSRLSTPLASAAVRGSPVGSAAVSWVSSVLSGGFGVAANTGARGTSVVDDVLAETAGATQRNLTSSYTLSADEALTAGQRWVGEGYVELGKPGSGVFRSADGLQQFRMDANSLMGNHAPGVPHVHLETYAPGARVPSVNNHIPFLD